MKKITFLLTLLLCFIGGGNGNAQTYTFKKFASASEAITDLSAIQDGGYYALKNVGRNAFIKISTSRDKFLANDGALTAEDHSDGLAVFKIHIANDGSDGTTKLYTFESALTGFYMPEPKDGTDHFVEATESPVTFEIRTLNSEGNKYSNNGVEDGNDIFYIKNSADDGNGAWFDMQPARFVGWEGKGANARYQIIPVTVSEDVTYRMITHRMVDADGNSLTDYPIPFEAKFYEDGTELTNPITSYYNPITLQNESNITGEGNTEFVYTHVKGTAPVSFSTADSKTWYRIQIENSGTRTLKAISEDDVYHVFTQLSAFDTTGLENYEGFRTAVWSFIESGTGVKVYNKGTDKYLKWESGYAQLVDGENNATTFYITQNTANDNRGFGLWTGTGNQYLNASERYGNTYNARLGVWNENNSKNDPGSCFIVADIDLNSDLLTVGKDLAKTAINAVTANEVDETYVTATTQDDIDRLVQKVNDATNLDQIEEAKYKGINMPFCDINPNAVYRIGCIAISADKNKYASVKSMPVGKDGSLETAYNANTGMDRQVYRVPASDADYMSQLWFLVPQENGTFKIRSANVDRCWCNDVSNNVDIPIAKGTGGNYTFEIKPDLTAFGNGNPNSSPSTTFLLSLDGKYVNAFNGDNAQFIKNYQNETDKGGYWQIEKVNSITVTVSAAGYASIGYPFAVQVPEESGVKAYYGKTAENGKLYLEEITGGLIPANTGAILVKEGGATLDLGIVTTEVAAIGDNKLDAATARRIGFAANDNYLLGVDNDNKVKFLVATITTVPANKAFLSATKVVAESTMSPALAFDFGDATGIGNVVSREEKEVEYYDLNGRRVLYPANGVFVTNNGRKVLIK